MGGSSFRFHGGDLMDEYCPMLIALVVGICWMLIG